MLRFVALHIECTYDIYFAFVSVLASYPRVKIKFVKWEQKPTQNEEGRNETTLSSIFLSSHSFHVYCLCFLDWKFYVCLSVCFFFLSLSFCLYLCRFIFLAHFFIFHLCVLCLFLLFLFIFSAPQFAATHCLFGIPSAIKWGAKLHVHLDLYNILLKHQSIIYT